jgi:hypothetical protein
MITHAVLSPSGAHRWLNCTPSARLEQKFPDTAGEIAREGTLAHRLSELLLRQQLKQVSKAIFTKELKEIESDPLYDHSMHEHAESYCAFVLERFSEAQAHTKDAIIFLEHKLNLTDYIPEGFGTGDAIIIADGVMDICDLKYGKGVLVDAKNNKQMMLYSLGALRDFDFVYDIHSVRMTIFQPRIDNYSSWEMTVEDLREWADEELKPKAALAFKGEGEFVPGSHCQFCRVKATCKAFANYNLEVAKYEFKDPALLDDLEITDILNRADIFSNWLNSVEEHALAEAVNNQKKWPGYKLVEGRSNRTYTSSDLVASKLLKAGFAEEIIYKKEVLGITAMEKTLGKKEFNIYLSDLVIKPPGKPTLVPESDKRPEYSSTERAAKDFVTE